MRVPVISVDNTPLMPTKPSRARRWIKDGSAIRC
ncbi:MAG: RRXRR domain-containing protein [Dolichospermum sp. DET50]|nr:RRXRR domain-containing protein [Dolichospermum sp. DET66]MBS3032323.1 RRXRR domain-containing protein [Dolichospermum sp. DET67]MBS3037528.1 RRXRR domain-containing protein [Dolichospermum sp. DET50]